MEICIEITKGPASGRKFSFEEHDTFLFGRGSDAHCKIEGDKNVSRNHFLLECNPPRLQLRDLGSTNGTYVNGRCYRGVNCERDAATGVMDTIELHDGDLIAVGETEIRVAVKTAPPPMTPALTICDDASSIEEDLSSMSSRRRRRLTPAAGAQQMPAEGNIRDQIITSKEPPKRASCILNDLLAGALEGSEVEEGPAISEFKLVRKIGAGSMGAVYHAQHRQSGDDVAIKMLLSSAAQNERARKLFFRETSIARELQHTNIVAYHGCGYTEGAFYLMLEFASGGNLEYRLMRHGGNLPWAVVLQLGYQALEGLSHAHDKGFIHRDIKPQNILLHAENGKLVVKLADMGLAKSVSTAGIGGFTATGAAGGTLKYVPREQIVDFKRALPSADVFSMAATLYTCITGSAIYDFCKTKSPLMTILEDTPIPIRQRDADLPTPLADIFDKALALEPEKRYQTAGDMLQALKPLLP